MDLRTQLKDHLKELSEATGPSGYEAPVRQTLAKVWQPLVDSLEVGQSGSLIGLKRGTGFGKEAEHRSIMICAHIDENGLIVRSIENGFLRVTNLGGPDARTLPGKPVLVHGRRTLSGVVALHPGFAAPASQQTEYPHLVDLWIDLGLSAEQVAELVGIGDTITLDATVLELQNNRLAGKAFDDRACVAAVTGCLQLLQSRTHSWDVLAVGSTQEESTGAGAANEAFRLRPDLAIALDVTFGTQPGVSEGDFALGGGVPISLGANFHPVLYDALTAAAERLEMPIHADPLPGHSGTDAWDIQVSRDGIPTALVNIPIRNMHSAIETVDLKDIERASRLLAEFISGLTPDFLATITWNDNS